LLPFSRAVVEPPELPGLGAEPQFELPRVSELLSGLLSELGLERWNPLFELLLPGRETSRPFPLDLPSCRLPFETCCDCPRSEERDAAAVLPRAEKKC
jgi:hypothetical protein